MSNVRKDFNATLEHFMKRISSLPTLLMLATFYTGCSSVIENRGYNPENVQLDQIRPGVHSKYQVQEILGSPSTIPTFDPNVWYYVSKTTAARSFFTPTVLNQQVTVVTFNNAGIVSAIKTYKGEEAKNIKPIDRKTETVGQDTGILREVFSNFGRISSKKPT
jgi:outer membrane protein assembly factor BamE (lipoprotein component of BamABCDE complex)